ncbi:MAG: hypothetical protein L0346_14005 [Chloroflexi bacterium]|nr:hypothetical protein [Chloroflexota bacterium]
MLLGGPDRREHAELALAALSDDDETGGGDEGNQHHGHGGDAERSPGRDHLHVGRALNHFVAHHPLVGP